MVLGGGEETRPFAGAALLRAGFADRALVARVAPLPADLAKVAAESSEINRRVLVARGVEPSRVTVLPGAAKTTYDEATALKRFLDCASLRQRTGRYRRISHPAQPVGVSARSGRAGKPSGAGFRSDRRVRHQLLVARPVGAGGRRRRVPEIGGLRGLLRPLFTLARRVPGARRRRSLCENACRLCFSITPCTAMPCVMLKHNLQTPLLALRASVPHLEPERRRRESSDLGPHRGWPVPPHSRA